MSRVGTYIREVRYSRGLSFGDVARACGASTARQTSTIAQRVAALARDEIVDNSLLDRVGDALDLDVDEVRRLAQLDRDENVARWDEWANKPVPIELHLSPFGGMWIRFPLPAELEHDEDGAIQFAINKTRRSEVRLALALDRKRTVFFVEGRIVSRVEATPEGNVVVPFMLVDGKPFQIAVTGEKKSGGQND